MDSANCTTEQKKNSYTFFLSIEDEEYTCVVRSDGTEIKLSCAVDVVVCEVGEDEGENEAVTA